MPGSGGIGGGSCLLWFDVRDKQGGPVKAWAFCDTHATSQLTLTLPPGASIVGNQVTMPIGPGSKKETIDIKWT